MHALSAKIGFVLLLTFAENIFAVNWLMLQGTEPPKRNYLLWGFVQPSYTADFGDSLSGLQGAASVNNGRRIANSTIAPWFSSQEKFHVRRARLGLRGRLPGFSDKDFLNQINYFILTESGNNLVTYKPFGERDQLLALTDLSLTFNYIPGVRIRLGLFKIPGPEELFQAVHAFDYIQFSDFIAREMLERFSTGNLAPAPADGPPTAFTTQGVPVAEAYGFSAGRDWGIEVFNSFRLGPWDLSYALMVGNGDAIKVSDIRIDNNLDRYLYFSSEYDLPGGKGPRKHGIKLYTWYHSGERSFSSDPESREFERVRFGFGLKAVGKLFGFKQRFSSELNFADGMIFFAPLGGVAGNPLRYAAEEGNKSRGLSIDYGFYVNQNWELDFRYDRHDLLYQQAGVWTNQDERIIEAFTLGINYHFTNKIRITANYLFRNARAPHKSTIYSPAANTIVTSNVRNTVSTLGDRLALQLTWIF